MVIYDFELIVVRKEEMEQCCEFARSAERPDLVPCDEESKRSVFILFSSCLMESLLLGWNSVAIKCTRSSCTNWINFWPSTNTLSGPRLLWPNCFCTRHLTV